MTLEIKPIGEVVAGRREVADDYWGGVESVIQLDEDEFPSTLCRGWKSSLIWWSFGTSAKRPRATSSTTLAARAESRSGWPTGTFAHRNQRRPNQLTQSFPSLLGVDGLRLRVTDLDAVVGTKICDLSLGRATPDSVAQANQEQGVCKSQGIRDQSHGSGTEPAIQPPNERGGMLGASSYWRVWQEARPFAFPPDKAGSLLARKPYDLRAACITNWLRAGLPVAEVARRAGNSPEVIHRRYAGCIDNSEEENNKKIERVMGWEA